MREGDVIGHEYMGEVVEVAPETTRLQVGDRVVVSGASLLTDGDPVRVIPGSEGE